MTLDELAIKYGSDKSSLAHNYCQVYERLIKTPPKKMLEIGVLHGASIRMWREFFPECEVHGLDLFIDNPIPEIEGVIWHKGNQCDWLLLEKLRGENFDLIISDGSHNCIDEWITFWGLISSCGLYVLEDAHCAESELFRQGLGFENTMLGQMKSERFPLKYQLVNDKIAFIYAQAAFL